MNPQVPRIPTTEWAVACFERIYKDDDPEQLDALLELLGGLCPTLEEAKHKHDVTWDVIEYGYRKTPDCDLAARRYLGVG